MYLKGFLFVLCALGWAGCAQTASQTQQQAERLSANEFSEKIAAADNAVIVDVRTPGEFAKGHLPGALNMNWNDSAFDSHVALLDKSAPVFVYCLSGGRSRSAVSKLQKAGFQHIYEMPGGMLEWRAAKLPETSPSVHVGEGMSMDDYHALLHSNALVLVDFYADWCVPCIKMKPYLERIGQDMGDRVTVVRINIDENRKISEELGIAALPVLMLYEHRERTWTHQGYLDEESIRKQLLK